jgi:hypothetical protein
VVDAVGVVVAGGGQAAVDTGEHVRRNGP